MGDVAHVLVVDDQPDNAELLRKMLRAEGLRVTTAASADAALPLLAEAAFDLLLLDVMMPGTDGLTFTRHLRAQPAFALLPILLVTAKADLPSVVEGLDAGADDYITKPVERRSLMARVRAALRAGRLAGELARAQAELTRRHQELTASYEVLVQRTREKEALQTEVVDLKRQMAEQGRFGEVVGRSGALRRVFEQVRLVAPTDVTVLIRGETGTGKELLARALHEASPRAAGPFVALNCGAIPESLLESELFGHEKGAFTGAIGRKAGHFERAGGGTLFLDEIGDVPLVMQVRLLRVLQERTFERVGGAEVVRADVRIVAATHKDLEAMVADGRLRQDLYYRLNVVPLTLPPLRERVEDLPALARHLLAKAARTHRLDAPELTPEAMAEILAHPWPGNVRELENALERALVLAGGAPIRRVLDPLQPRPAVPAGPTDPGGPPLDLPFKEWKDALLTHHERRWIVAALSRHGGNMTAAGRETGVDAKTFQRKIRQYDIRRAEYLPDEGPARPAPGRPR